VEGVEAGGASPVENPEHGEMIRCVGRHERPRARRTVFRT
jgi:hypothetical protein